MVSITSVSFLGWRGFTPVSEGLCIAYSVTVAEDLHPHLKDHSFCETNEVGKVHREKENWEYMYKEWGLGSQHQFLFYKASVLEMGKMSEGRTFNLKVLFYFFLSNAKFKPSSLKFVNPSAAVG